MRRLIRAVVASSSLAFACAGLPAQAEAPIVARQAPGFYRMRLGTFEITALLDGTHTFPISSVLQRPRADGSGARELLSIVRPGEAEARLAQEALSLPFEGSINAFLVNTGGKLVLIDTGAGALYGACCGKLLDHLRAAGYAPEQVDEVLLTHLHADHFGGVMANGRAAFPNAIVRAGRKDIAYWLDPRNEGAAPAFLLPMFRGAQAVLKPYVEAGRLLPLDDGEEPVAGIRALATPGHTPGHISYRVTSGTDTLLVWGDIVHVAPIQFPDPSVTVTYDSEAAGAEARRESLFSQAARGGYWIAAAHIAFPGLGHIKAEGGRFLWIPANYTTELTAPAR